MLYLKATVAINFRRELNGNISLQQRKFLCCGYDHSEGYFIVPSAIFLIAKYETMLRAKNRVAYLSAAECLMKHDKHRFCRR